ncbi:hypothetical protein EUA98_16850 [Pengzhenrongella frigida]|uniref:Uncharacterized protein n=1 Tax=Pengzhenrongella frigida TaxID=1259133 RepID=A0A4V1ZGU8_9MICO|nr:hypothetical protein EUA98_16850 [Cellulomonas sp. HLT2-17]
MIDDPAQWPEPLMREHPRVALIETDSGEVISTWDRLVCGQDPSYLPALQEAWAGKSIVIVDMDTNELLRVVDQVKK